METFLPYDDFQDSALHLDKQRCWKQVVEASQIITVLERGSGGWVNHPAVQMWKGYEGALQLYFNTFCLVALQIHHINTKFRPKFVPEPHIMPWWLGNENFHRAMRARLIVKNRDYYLPFWPKDEGFNNGKYFWPVMDGSKTFKVI